MSFFWLFTSKHFPRIHRDFSAPAVRQLFLRHGGAWPPATGHTAEAPFKVTASVISGWPRTPSEAALACSMGPEERGNEGQVVEVT